MCLRIQPAQRRPQVGDAECLVGRQHIGITMQRDRRDFLQRRALAQELVAHRRLVGLVERVAFGHLLDGFARRLGLLRQLAAQRDVDRLERVEQPQAVLLERGVPLIQRSLLGDQPLKLLAGLTRAIVRRSILVLRQSSGFDRLDELECPAILGEAVRIIERFQATQVVVRRAQIVGVGQQRADHLRPRASLLNLAHQPGNGAEMRGQRESHRACAFEHRRAPRQRRAEPERRLLQRDLCAISRRRA